MSYTREKRDNVLRYIAEHPNLNTSLADVGELNISEFDAKELTNDFFVMGYTNNSGSPEITELGKRYLDSKNQ